MEKEDHRVAGGMRGEYGIMRLVLFGAHAIARGFYQAVKELCPGLKPECFLVSDAEKKINADCIDGIPVCVLSEFSQKYDEEQRKDLVILIAVQEYFMAYIEEMLESYGFYHHVRVDSRRWAEYMERYYTRTGMFKPLSAWPVGFHPADIRLYMVKSGKDTPLNTEFVLPEYIQPILAGGALQEEKAACPADDTGDHISEKNRNYSELTALYWIWKNVLSKEEKTQGKYYGLTHYRRILSLTDDDLLRLTDNGIDVVMPYPMPYEPNMEKHHQTYLRQEDWDALLTAVEELQPEYAKAFPEILSQPYMFHYNIILARGDVLGDYCAWLFPILERIEELSVPKGNERADRYIGYMGESLETLYFMYNRDKLNISYAGCRTLV